MAYEKNDKGNGFVNRILGAVPEQAVATAAGVIQQPAASGSEQQQGSTYTPGSFYDYYTKNNAYQFPTKEEVDAERERIKRNALFASIGDGLNAFHQAYANARGVKPMTENSSQAGKVLDRYDNIRRVRDAERAKWVEGAMKAKQADQAAAQAHERNQLDKLRQDRLDRETAIKEAKAEAYRNYQLSVTSKNEAQAAYWLAMAQSLEAGESRKEALVKAQIAKEQAQANQANANANLADTRAANVGATRQVQKISTDAHGRTSSSTIRTSYEPNSSGGASGSGAKQQQQGQKAKSKTRL